ncbi:hypothetical protein Bbelb_257940 [Branchiostoma belcheri]|nr:hypothetical protein Bbelb_257940 [Branchiostoma belcheri]
MSDTLAERSAALCPSLSCSRAVTSNPAQLPPHTFGFVRSNLSVFVFAAWRRFKALTADLVVLTLRPTQACYPVFALGGEPFNSLACPPLQSSRPKRASPRSCPRLLSGHDQRRRPSDGRIEFAAAVITFDLANSELGLPAEPPARLAAQMPRVGKPRHRPSGIAVLVVHCHIDIHL